MLTSLGKLLQRIGRSIRPSELQWLDQVSAEQLARDIGVPPDELSRLSKLGPEAANLLYQRLALESLDAQEIGKMHPTVMKDMQRVCSVCNDKKRCMYDQQHGEGSDDWKSYCPNALTIDYLGR